MEIGEISFNNARVRIQWGSVGVLIYCDPISGAAQLSGIGFARYVAIRIGGWGTVWQVIIAPCKTKCYFVPS